MYFTGNDGFQNFLVFVPMLSSIILDRNKKVTNWRLTGIAFRKNKSFDTNLESIMSNLANGRVILIFNNSVLVQKSSYSLHSNFILNFYINSFPLKNCSFGTVKLVGNTIESKFTYNGRGISFDGEGEWSFGNDNARNVVSLVLIIVHHPVLIIEKINFWY